MIKPWLHKATRQLGDFRIFTLRSDVKVSPRTGKEHDFFILDSVNWVNVIPLTPDNQLIMVEQYRHGSNTVELEIPGGMMDRNESSPLATGLRELREETGYEGDPAQVIGQVFANPAILTNSCFTILVQNSRLVHPVEFDGGEDIITRLVPVVEIPHLVKTAQIRHSLVVVALYHFDLWQRRIT